MLIVPDGPARTEIVVVNSRFIASADYAGSVDEARAFIARIKGEFPDATHNVSAFIVGGGLSRMEFCSDDGEPSGTSGRPALAVLRGSGLGNVVLVITRYFGGTLLGAGGLVKAYSESAKAALALVRRAELVDFCRFELALPYTLYEPFTRLAAESGARIIRENFAENVGLTVDVPEDDFGGIESRIADISSGAVVPKRVDTFAGRRKPQARS